MINKKISLNSGLSINIIENHKDSANCKTPECNRYSIEDRPTTSSLIDYKNINKDGFGLKNIVAKTVDLTKERNLLAEELIKLSPLKIETKSKKYFKF